MENSKSLSHVILFLALVTTSPLQAGEELLMIATDDAVAFVPDHLSLAADERVNVIVEGEEGQVLGQTVFIKRNSIASFFADGMQIVGEKAGETELYVIRGGQVFSLPIEIKPAAIKPVENKADENSAVENHPAKIEQAVSKPQTNPADVLNSIQTPAQADLTDFVTEAMTADSGSENSMPAPEAKALLIGKNTFIIKAFDDRSDPNDNLVYPAGNILIEIPAMNISANTNVRGEARLDLPMDSHFMIYVSDRSGRFIDTQKEVFTGHADEPRLQLNVMRDFNFNAMNNLSGSIQNAGLSSLCGTVKYHGLQDGLRGETMAVDLDHKADGPYYFNRLGLLDRTIGHLDRNGRFCFFNIEPGLAALSVFVGKAPIYTQPHYFVGGYHQEEEYDLNDQFGYGTQISVQSDAETYLRTPEIKWNDATGIVDIYPFGMGKQYRSDGNGVVSLMNQNTNLLDPRLFVFVNEPDLTPTVYQLSPLVGFQPLPVLPVYPRGFVEDLALRTDTVIDERYGHIVAQYRYGVDDKRQRAVSIQVVDAYGRNQVAESLATYHEETAIYINLMPGYYQVIASEPGSDGRDRVIDVQSAYVYSGAVTSVISGFRSLVY